MPFPCLVCFACLPITLDRSLFGSSQAAIDTLVRCIGDRVVNDLTGVHLSLRGRELERLIHAGQWYIGCRGKRRVRDCESGFEYGWRDVRERLDTERQRLVLVGFDQLLSARD